MKKKCHVGKIGFSKINFIFAENSRGLKNLNNAEFAKYYFFKENIPKKQGN